MKARQIGRQPRCECASRTRQQCQAVFASWLGVVAARLANSGLRAKGGGQN